MNRIYFPRYHCYFINKHLTISFHYSCHHELLKTLKIKQEEREKESATNTENLLENKTIGRIIKHEKRMRNKSIDFKRDLIYCVVRRSKKKTPKNRENNLNHLNTTITKSVDLSQDRSIVFVFSMEIIKSIDEIFDRACW